MFHKVRLSVRKTRCVLSLKVNVGSVIFWQNLYRNVCSLTRQPHSLSDRKSFLPHFLSALELERWSSYHGLVKKENQPVFWIHFETLLSLSQEIMPGLFSNTFNATKKTCALHTLGAVSIIRSKKYNTYLQLFRDWMKLILLSTSIFTLSSTHCNSNSCVLYYFFVTTFILMQNKALEKKQASTDTIQ